MQKSERNFELFCLLIIIYIALKSKEDIKEITYLCLKQKPHQPNNKIKLKSEMKIIQDIHITYCMHLMFINLIIFH